MSLSNADFRQILMTPRVGAPSSTASMARPAVAATPKAEKKKERKKMVFRRYWVVHVHGSGSSSVFRATNTDKEVTEKVTAQQLREKAITSEMEQLEKARENMTAEETKYLGGDVEHTHLVKGS